MSLELGQLSFVHQNVGMPVDTKANNHTHGLRSNEGVKRSRREQVAKRKVRLTLVVLTSRDSIHNTNQCNNGTGYCDAADGKLRLFGQLAKSIEVRFRSQCYMVKGKLPLVEEQATVPAKGVTLTAHCNSTPKRGGSVVDHQNDAEDNGCGITSSSLSNKLKDGHPVYCQRHFDGSHKNDVESPCWSIEDSVNVRH